MSYLSDTLTVGLILVLVFGSIALYLYTRVQQTEQKVSLLESIVLDLKLTGEISSFSDPQPFTAPVSDSSISSSLFVSPVSSASPASPVSSASSVSSASPASPVSSISSPSAPDQVLATVQEEPLSEYKPFDEDEAQEPIAFHSLDSQISIADAEPLEPLEQLESLGQEVQVEAIPMSSYDHMSVKELQAEARSRGLYVEKGAKKHALIELLKKADAEAKPVSTSSLASLEPFPHDEE